MQKKLINGVAMSVILPDLNLQTRHKMRTRFGISNLVLILCLVCKFSSTDTNHFEICQTFRPTKEFHQWYNHDYRVT